MLSRQLTLDLRQEFVGVKCIFDLKGVLSVRVVECEAPKVEGTSSASKCNGEVQWVSLQGRY